MTRGFTDLVYAATRGSHGPNRMMGLLVKNSVSQSQTIKVKYIYILKNSVKVPNSRMIHWGWLLSSRI